MIRKTLISSCLVLVATTVATDALYYGEFPTLYEFGSIKSYYTLVSDQRDQQDLGGLFYLYSAYILLLSILSSL